MSVEVWDFTSGNLLGEFANTDDAFAWLRRLHDQHGADALDGMGLCDTLTGVTEGDALVSAVEAHGAAER